jgi:hypothetical protein
MYSKIFLTFSILRYVGNSFYVLPTDRHLMAIILLFTASVCACVVFYLQRAWYIPHANRAWYIPHENRAWYIPHANRAWYIPQANRAWYIPHANRACYIPHANRAWYIPHANRAWYIPQANHVQLDERYPTNTHKQFCYCTY